MATQNPPTFPFPLPAPDSMPIADAGKWYLATVPLIVGALIDDEDHLARLSDAWQMKSRLRLAAALSLYDQELVEEFFQAFPLPRIEDLRQISSTEAGDEPTAIVALKALVAVSERELRAFPGTVGEAIGLEIWNGQRRYIMTENGWQPKP
jgi:hypothetical protein